MIAVDILHADRRGMSLLEMLIATIISAIVIAAALDFYVTQHKTWLTQNDVAEVQQNARVCLEEIAREMRMAGYRTGSHPALRIGEDSVTIYYMAGTDIDTFLYYVHWYDTTRPVLMRQINNGTPAVYSDDVEALAVTQLSASLLELQLTTRGRNVDREIVEGDGLRRRTMSTQVRVRNLLF